jgi:hypothetical protein
MKLRDLDLYHTRAAVSIQYASGRSSAGSVKSAAREMKPPPTR